jgi:hypothetical protein
LERTCGGNDSLRQAVEVLIKSHEETSNFVDTPAYQAAAEMLVVVPISELVKPWPTTRFFRCSAKVEWNGLFG